MRASGKLALANATEGERRNALRLLRPTVPVGKQDQLEAGNIGAARPCRALSANSEMAMSSYDPDNVFAKILRGEIPSHKVYEDERAFAFLDIMPRSPGHTLVIPKAAARNILDIDPDDFAHVAKIAQKIAKAAMKVFDAQGVTVQQFSEPAGGQVVFHLHVHVMPRRDGVPLKPPASVKEDPAVLADQARKLATALQNG
jgi:histidine triad (HIT) family protein